MEIPDISSARNSTSSALEIPGPSAAESPTQASFPRRRLSWSRSVDAGQLDTHPSKMVTTGPGDDDLFYSPSHEFPINTPLPEHTNPYRTLQARQSTSSLIPQPQSEPYEEDEDDEAGLTQNMAASGSSDPENKNQDLERTGDSTPRSRRRTARYTDTSSLKKTFKSVSRSLHRASLRVVNFSNAALESQVRLEDDDEPGIHIQQVQEHRWSDTPLRGRTLGVFNSHSRLRLALYYFLVHRWTEPSILLLIILNAVVLTIQSARSLTLPSDGPITVPPGYFYTWEDFALFVIFIVYTLEAFSRICVSGFLLDPEIRVFSIFSPSFYQISENFPVTSTNTTFVSRQSSLSRHGGHSITRLLHKIRDILLRPFRLAPIPSKHYPHQPLSAYSNGSPTTLAQEAHTTFRDPAQPTYLSNIMKSDSDTLSLPFKLNINHVHDKIHRNIPYLRQSWCRIDFVAIISFWITFTLALSGVERGKYHIGVFRAMSVIRCARLLGITSGTTTIMHSLKLARPLLASTAYFVLFAMIIFSIISVQAFHGALRRSCWLQPTLGENATQLNQFCGGHINSTTLQTEGYVKADGTIAPTSKGFICPVGQLCMETRNPYSNIESFDTIYNAALQVIVIASANTWASLMYSTLDAEYFVSCIFFIVCVIVMNFWLFNLFVAVITNTFASIRIVTQKSAFGAARLAPNIVEEDSNNKNRTVTKKNLAYDIINYTKWFWIFLALASLALQATRTANMSALHEAVLYYGECAITAAFDIEIVLRFMAILPDWRTFFRHGNDVFDLILALGSSIIQLPVIHSSPVYPWFTIIQLARFYRVILVVPHMKPMLLELFGNLYGLFNMTLFLLMVNLLAALVAVQFLRGDLPGSLLMNFGNLYNSFLAMYQICSSENWTTVLYNAATAEAPLGQAVPVLIYLALWLLFSCFIILQMFIAVLHENFSMAEEGKKKKQATNYWEKQESSKAKPTWARKLNPYRWLRANPVTIEVDNMPSNLVLPLQKSLVQDYNRMPSPEHSQMRETSKSGHYASKSISALQRLFVGEANTNDIPLQNLRHARNRTLPTLDEDGPDRHLALLASVGDEASNEDLNDILYERRARKADFILFHPSYDKTFWIFPQKHPVRWICQKLVQPAGGERIFGVQPSPVAHTIFQLVLLLVVIGTITVEGLATPLYRRAYSTDHPNIRIPWFCFTDAAFGLTFFFEFIIKGIADGYIFTPNAYIKSIWNVLDFFIMAGFSINVITGVVFVGGISRLTRAFRALPTLRLITLVDRMRYSFQSSLLTGVRQILDAAVLCFLYLIPYAVWGLNIFAGKMNQCNDGTGDVSGLADCTFEYTNNIYGNTFGYMAPRVWNKPTPSTTFSFDSFEDSLLILFEIVSLEGWIDVLAAATSITGLNQQPATGSSPSNAIFFVIFNLLGGVVLLTVFVSIIINNFSVQTGTAYLTMPQREWIDLQKLIKRQRPSKRPKVQPTNRFRAWCFDRAVQKHGWWSRAMTVLIVLHIVALMTQTDGPPGVADSIRTTYFLVFTGIYIIDVSVRFFGLGWSSFRANGWNLFDLFVSIGTFLTTLAVQAGNQSYVVQSLQKLFLVSIAFKLVQKTDSLNMLFKTSVASLPAILSLLGLWIVFFLFFAILYLEIFSMTKWASAETRYQNYTSLGRAIVMLIFMTTGEGWNQYMHDFDLEYPRCTNLNASLSESDCGSTAWAFSLFIAWNLLSMYIFANLFTGVVVQNFSYVYQSSAASTKSIMREEMRAFKKVWAELADPKSGYLPPSQFGLFFTRLSGVFEVRVYPAQHSINSILSSCQADRRSKLAVNGLDIRKLTKKLNKIDYASIRKRRAIYTRLYHEAQISHDGQGMTFTGMLILLAHHKIIVDAEALILKDFMIRSETNRLVTDLVNLDRVRSLLKMVATRRKYLVEREQAKMGDVPSIIVEVMPSTPPSSSRDISSALYDLSPSSSVSGSPMTDRLYSMSDLSLAVDGISRLQRSPRRTSDVSMLSTDLGARSPTISFLDDDPQAILASVQNSVWGELMQEAAKEDEQL